VLLELIFNNDRVGSFFENITNPMSIIIRG
jgi:hypothetical protein